ncbi:MAG: hypothetical protein R3D34_12070 [Nitratireductor sp.]
MVDDLKAYDAAVKWSPLPVWEQAVISGEGFSVRPLFGLHRLLVSDKMAGAIKLAMPAEKPIGFMAETRDENAVLQIARDRVLMVSNRPLELSPGWHKQGFAVSEASDAWLCLELTGENRMSVLSQGTSLDPASGSPSAMVQFAGVPCAIHQARGGRILLHVECGQAAYLWAWFSGCSS